MICLENENFDEVENRGQVITRKDKHDGRKTEFEARFVVWGFQEKMEPQSESPTALLSEGFRLASVGIRGAFLQAKILGRDVFVQPPKDIRKESEVRFCRIGVRKDLQLVRIGDASYKEFG